MGEFVKDMKTADIRDVHRKMYAHSIEHCWTHLPSTDAKAV